MTFGERLIEVRKENGYSNRSTFAQKLGIPTTTLRNYETNLREPGYAFLRRIANMFNISADYLLCLTDEKYKKTLYHLTNSEAVFLTKYRKLDSNEKEIINFTLEKMSEHSKPKENIIPLHSYFTDVQAAKDYLSTQKQLIAMEITPRTVTDADIITIANEIYRNNNRE